MIQTAVKTKKPRNQAISGRFCAGRTYRGRIKDDHKIDPACGSGNFLTETYLSLRRLENEVIGLLNRDQITMDMDNPIKVSISQFYGIEINDFAVTVAKTALWIAESQKMKETEDVVHMSLDFLPLKTNAYIVEDNALRLDWESVVPKHELNYIMGNPPFVGAHMMGKEQKDDVNEIFAGWKNAGNLDYVACWYKKVVDLMQGTSIRAALVSTNSVTQGVLDARALYPDCSLADLYDEVAMPPELRKAHQENDKAVMDAYGFTRGTLERMNEAACVAALMKMYQRLTEG